MNIFDENKKIFKTMNLNREQRDIRFWTDKILKQVYEVEKLEVISAMITALPDYRLQRIIMKNVINELKGVD